MGLFLILLAAGDSTRLNSKIPKPFHIVNDKTLLEHSFNAFKDLHKIKVPICHDTFFQHKITKHNERNKFIISMKISMGSGGCVLVCMRKKQFHFYLK